MLKKIVIGVSVLTIVITAEIPKFNPEYSFVHTPNQKYGQLDSITWTNAGGKYVSVKHADWDNDGDKDIFSGYMNKYGGKSSILYYENIGSDEEPVFEYKRNMPIDVGGE